jgi:hypothetical protein
MSSHPFSSRRRSGNSPSRGTVRISDSIAETAAAFYLELAGGTPSQQLAAAEWKRMFLSIQEGTR